MKMIAKAIIFSLAVSLISYLLLESSLLSIMLAIIAIPATTILEKLLKKRTRQKKAKSIEKALPFELIAISTELGIGLNAEKAIQNSSLRSNAFSRALKESLKRTEQTGKNTREALFELAENSHSIEVKKSLLHLTNILEQGAKRKTAAKNIQRIAKEQLAKQRIETKAYQGKTAILSIALIAVSAIMPAMLQSFAIITNSFLEIGISAIELLLITTIGFPLAEITILFIIQELNPLN